MNVQKYCRAPYVFVASVALLGFYFWHAIMTFDEGFYVKAARELLMGEPTSNGQHPPLAKYFIAASIKVFGDNPFGWRFPSIFAGALVAVAVFGITFRLTRERRTAMIAWLLTVANGFWLVISRVAMISIYEFAFELAGVWLFLIAKEEDRTSLYALSGALFGLSIGCRWAGGVGLIACLIVAVLERTRLGQVVLMLATTIAAYLVIWIPLLVREHRPLTYIVAANQYIYHFHRYFPVYPGLGQPWWTWIFRLEPQQSFDFLVGNPVIGVLGLFAVVALLVKRTGTSYIISLLYLGHLGQWVVGMRPMTFYYYYFEAFSVLAPALAIALRGAEWRKVRIDVAVTALSFLFFAYWYPSWAVLPEPFDRLMGPH